jgi:hypothetical protein
MNYKDKEAFEKWFKDFYEVDFNAGNASFMGQLISWQAACEYTGVNMKINANEATELIAGVLEELSKSVFQGNHEQDFLWRARVIVGSLEKLGVEVEYEND